MRLPIRTDELAFIVATPPRPAPAVGGTSGQTRQDRDGHPIYTFDVLATSGADADVLGVQVDVRIDVSVGDAVRLCALTAECWEMQGRSVVSFRAEGVERVTGRGAADAEPARGERS